jgi:serine/threonine protein kinase
MFCHRCLVLQGMILHTLLGVAQGMQWLHEHNVLHGDLKAANVMLSIVASSSSSSVGEGNSGAQADGSKQQGEDDDAAGGHELLPKVSGEVWCYDMRYNSLVCPV